MKTWKDKIALVTGASSGIGAATARKLSEEGMKVILVARRLPQMLGLVKEIEGQGGKAEALQADLTQEKDRVQIYRQVKLAYGGADVLVNNAGFGWYGYGAEMPWQTAWEMLQVNIAAVVHLSLLFLKDMKARNFGYIINVGSISGSLPSQGVALYGATKSFLDNFTTALHREMAGTRVRFSVVRAGPVKTEFGETAKRLPGGLRVPTDRIGVTAQAVADRIFGLLRWPRRVVYIPRYLALTPWVENAFGWIIDRVGPLLLKKESKQEDKK